MRPPHRAGLIFFCGLHVAHRNFNDQKKWCAGLAHHLITFQPYYSATD